MYLVTEAMYRGCIRASPSLSPAGEHRSCGCVAGETAVHPGGKPETNRRYSHRDDATFRRYIHTMMMLFTPRRCYSHHADTIHTTPTLFTPRRCYSHHTDTIHTTPTLFTPRRHYSHNAYAIHTTMTPYSHNADAVHTTLTLFTQH